MLLAREAGFDLPADPALASRLHELTLLRASIGRAGLLALEPLRATTSRDQWQWHLLQQTVDPLRSRIVVAIRRSVRRVVSSPRCL